jgi:hypothetical protein
VTAGCHRAYISIAELIYSDIALGTVVGEENAPLDSLSATAESLFHCQLKSSIHTHPQGSSGVAKLVLLSTTDGSCLSISSSFDSDCLSIFTCSDHEYDLQCAVFPITNGLRTEQEAEQEVVSSGAGLSDGCLAVAEQGKNQLG